MKKFAKMIYLTKHFLGKHSPEILTGIGISGMIGTVILSVKATPKAMIVIQDKKDELHVDNLKIKDTVQVAWKYYIPAGVTGIASIACLIGGSAVNYKRNAALATAYAISESTLLKYKDKVIETIGERKEKEIEDKIAQDNVNNNQLSNSQVIITSKGDTLCMDSISGRYFRSDLDTINKIINKLNRELTYNYYVSLADFYYEIGLPQTKNSSNLGWNLNDGLIELNVHTCLAENDQPCIVLDYNIAPRYEFDKLM